MRAVTLLFHDVVPEGRWDSSGFQGAGADVYKLDCGVFRQHVAAIHGFCQRQPVTGEELLSGAALGVPFLLTFDDGGASASQYIADILDEFGWKAHFFVTAGRVGTSGFLNQDQMLDLRRRGHVIGSHSYSHPTRMAHCSTAKLDDEWRRSMDALGDSLGETLPIASVPGGYYSRAVARSAAQAGVRLLFTSEPVTASHTIDDCLVLGRFTAKRNYDASWSAAIVADRDMRRTREYVFWNAKKGAKAILGGAWLKARTRLLEHRVAKLPAASEQLDHPPHFSGDSSMLRK